MVENGVLKKAKEWAYVHAGIQTFLQRRPNTVIIAEVSVELPGGRLRKYSDWGCSKVRLPDVWDEAEGARIARGKATALIAKKMVADGWKPTESPPLQFDKES